MSDNVLSYGLMAPLAYPITDEALLEEINEQLYDSGSCLKINYEGTLIYSDISNSDDCYGGIFFVVNKHYNHFFDAIDKYHMDFSNEYIIIDDALITPYTSYWYNGTDSYMDELTIEKFNKEVEPEPLTPEMQAVFDAFFGHLTTEDQVPQILEALADDRPTISHEEYKATIKNRFSKGEPDA